MTHQAFEFKAWPKTPREGTGYCTITEKIDGTNACVVIQDGAVVGCQSRNRAIKPGDDNMGFAFWVYENADELAAPGDGYHYGEWAGPGIQKNPHNLPEKQFFLFNTHRPADSLPPCVRQVPVLYEGAHADANIEGIMDELWRRATADGYEPEGVVITHHATPKRHKRTFKHTEGKWK